jgi:hypothetical protein
MSMPSLLCIVFTSVPVVQVPRPYVAHSPEEWSLQYCIRQTRCPGFISPAHMNICTVVNILIWLLAADTGDSPFWLRLIEGRHMTVPRSFFGRLVGLPVCGSKLHSMTVDTLHPVGSSRKTTDSTHPDNRPQNNLTISSISMVDVLCWGVRE